MKLSLNFLRDYVDIDENIADIIPQYDLSDNVFMEQYMSRAFRYLLENEPVLISRNNDYLMVDNTHLTSEGSKRLNELLVDTIKKVRKALNKPVPLCAP